MGGRGRESPASSRRTGATGQLTSTFHPALPHLDFDDGPGLRQWWNPQVGWGVVLPENEDLEAAERASASDRVPAVAKLIEHRKAVVPRHRTELMPGHLRRY